MSKKQMGFTLIEIVMVLVLLGILSAIAVPKYFDLRDKAEQKTAQATLAEIQARLNGAFADSLLKGASCKNTGTDGNTAGARSTALAEIKDFSSDAFTVSGIPTADAGGLVTITLTSKTSGTKYEYVEGKQSETSWIPQLAIPKCSGDK